MSRPGVECDNIGLEIARNMTLLGCCSVEHRKGLRLAALAVVGMIMVSSCGKRETLRMPTNDRANKVDLNAYRWKNRLVLVVALSGRNRLYGKQQSEFQSKAAQLDDRDILMFELLHDGKSTVGNQTLTFEQQSFIRRQFEVPEEDFVFILVGKDGTVKLRASEPVSADILFDLIDSMPMRRAEMAERTENSEN